MTGRVYGLLVVPPDEHNACQCYRQRDDRSSKGTNAGVGSSKRTNVGVGSSRRGGVLATE